MCIFPSTGSGALPLHPRLPGPGSPSLIRCCSVSAGAFSGLCRWRSWSLFPLEAEFRIVSTCGLQPPPKTLGRYRESSVVTWSSSQGSSAGEPGYSGLPHVYWFEITFAILDVPKLCKPLHHWLYKLFASCLNLPIYSIIFFANQKKPGWASLSPG